MIGGGRRSAGLLFWSLRCGPEEEDEQSDEGDRCDAETECAQRSFLGSASVLSGVGREILELRFERAR